MTDPAYRGLAAWERAGIKQGALEDSLAYREAEKNREAVYDLCAEFARKIVDYALAKEIETTTYIAATETRRGYRKRGKASAQTARDLTESIFERLVEDFYLPTGEEAAS